MAEAVELGSATGDAVAAATELDAGAAAIALARLELLGYVETECLGALRAHVLESAQWLSRTPCRRCGPSLG